MKLWFDAVRHNDVMWSVGEGYGETFERFVSMVRDSGTSLRTRDHG